ncbi:hypothetical protein B7494_g7388 [Chlorociboria aeruginascens]|nr:hypothetical protein B7494_g7388 [Chlorociboria aeruginascens]
MDSGDEMDLDRRDELPLSRKRKASSELSTNPHTVKARRRLEKLNQDPIRMRVERAKANDQAAVTVARNKVRKTEAFKKANPTVQEQMLSDCAAAAKLKRVRDGKDAATIAKSLGWGIHGGLYTVDDDENSAWEDIDYESDADEMFESMWRDDEKMNHDGEVPEKSADLLEEDSKSIHNALINKQKSTEFRLWQKHWLFQERSLAHKVRKLSEGGFDYILRHALLRILKQQGSYRKALKWIRKQKSLSRIIPGPDKFFTTGEKAIWKNICAWAYEDDEWIELPGPADWWPDDQKKLDATGFVFSEIKHGHLAAFHMLLMDESLIDEDEYGRLYPYEDDLYIMEDDSTSRMGRKAFLSLVMGNNVTNQGGRAGLPKKSPRQFRRKKA